LNFLALILGITIPVGVVGLLMVGYFIYRKKKLADWKPKYEAAK